MNIKAIAILSVSVIVVMAIVYRVAFLRTLVIGA